MKSSGDKDFTFDVFGKYGKSKRFSIENPIVPLHCAERKSAKTHSLDEPKIMSNERKKYFGEKKCFFPAVVTSQDIASAVFSGGIPVVLAPQNTNFRQIST